MPDSNGNGITTKLTYVPTNASKVKQIGFIQVVRKATLGGEPAYGNKPADMNYYKDNFAVDPTLGVPRVDILRGEDDLYYNAKWVSVHGSMYTPAANFYHTAA